LDFDDLERLEARDDVTRGQVAVVLRRQPGVLLAHLEVSFLAGFLSPESSFFISKSRFTRNDRGIRLPFSQRFTGL
jgi:hypothetical protein